MTTLEFIYAAVMACAMLVLFAMYLLYKDGGE